MSGYGKTRLTQAFLKPLNRVLVLDYNQEYDAHGFEPLSIAEAGDRLLTEHRRWRAEPSLRWAIQGAPDDIIEGTRVAWRLGFCLLVIEEIDIHCRGPWLPDDLFRLVTMGRHRAVSLVGISRNAASVPKQFSAQRSTIVTFRQTEPPHLLAIRDYGFDPAVVQTLGRDEYLVAGDSLDAAKRECLASMEPHALPDYADGW